MKKSRFTEVQILVVLKQHGVSIRLACVVCGISETGYGYQATLDGRTHCLLTGHIVVELAHCLGGEAWQDAFVERVRQGGIERVLL